MTPDIVSREEAETGDLVALFHRLHALGVTLALENPFVDDVVRMVLDLLDDVAPLLPAIRRTAPDVLDILGQLDQVRDIPALTTEVTEAHRLLGHGLRDHDIEPGPPMVPVGELLRSGRLVERGNGKPLPISGPATHAG